MADTIIPDYHGPKETGPVLDRDRHERVWRVTKDLLNGEEIHPLARRGLRDAIDKADAVPDKRMPRGAIRT